MINKLGYLALSLALALSLFTGCGSSSAQVSESNNTSTEPQTTPKTEELIKIKVADNPFIGVAPVYTALEKGIFEKYGLEVELVNFDDPSQSTSALISGNVDVAGGTLDSSLIVADQYKDQMPQVISIRDDSAGADGIVAKNGIETVADLRGKTVGVAVNQTTHFLLQQALEKAGVSESEINLVDMNSSDAGASFISGNIDAAVTWEPYLSNAAKSGVGKMIFSSADAPGSIMDIVMVSKKTADEEPEWVVPFLQALEEARAYVEDSKTRDDAMEITAKYLDVSKEEALEMIPTIKLYSTSETVEALSDGGLAYDVVDKVSEFYTSKNIISSPINPKDILNDKFAKQVK